MHFIKLICIMKTQEEKTNSSNGINTQKQITLIFQYICINSFLIVPTICHSGQYF